ncbi:MAG TPA: GNAT family N-acetyltransferase [Cryomorphaceae bacterium]|nr:GNAT family N-acetyltransferase [Cryomorphaceae bacterium]
MKKNSSIQITNNTDSHQFEAKLDGHKGELVYRLRDNKIYFMHTWVPEAISGRGVASALALHALKYADSQGLETVIYCPFIQNFVKKHPNWKEL